MSNKSESIIKLMTALSDFQESCPSVPKTKTNPHLKNKYAGLEDIMGTIRKPLKEAGLVISQLPGDGTLTTLLAHFESGEFVQSTITLAPVKDKNPQAVGSALTYARRYTLSAVLGLPIGEEDDDAHKASKPKAAKKNEALNPSHKHWNYAIEQLATDKKTIEQIKKALPLDEDNKKLLVAAAASYKLKQGAKSKAV